METLNYTQFKFDSNNREISERHVQKIKQSIKDFGYIAGRPVLVSPEFVIIDGQHRYLAMKELEMPIVYEVLTGDSIQKVMALNANQAQWKIEDYIKSYANQGIECYRQLLRFEEKYKLGLTKSIDVFFISKHGATNEIKKGKTFDFNKQSDQVAEFINSLEKTPFVKKMAFIRAIVYLFKKANPQQIEYIRNNVLMIPNCSNMGEFVTVFENMLNKNKKQNFIKL